MTYQELLQLKHQRAEKVKEGKALLAKKDFAAHKTLMDEVDEMNTQIDAVEKQLQEEGINPGTGEQIAEKAFGAVKDPQEDPYQKAVKALADAARAGFPATKAAGEMMNGTEGADGGYTVPQDIVTKIIERRESKESLLGEVRVIHVKTRTGRRTFKKRSQHTGFSTVAEAAKFGRKATPQFETLEYTIEKRGGVLPVTNELMADSDNNIAGVVVEWMGDEARVTANNEIIAVIKETKEQVDLVDLDGILAAWIGLGTQFRHTSKLITNDDGLLWLTSLTDQNGRKLLTPNPGDPHKLQLCVGPHTLPIKTYDNDTIPSDGTKIPFILGDLKEGVVYWDRKQFSLRLSDTAVVGDLNAFEQDLTLWRGSLRDDCTKWDEEAFVYGYIDSVAATVLDEGDDTGAAEG